MAGTALDWEEVAYHSKLPHEKPARFTNMRRINNHEEH
jgi:hypothetical protein